MRWDVGADYGMQRLTHWGGRIAYEEHSHLESFTIRSPPGMTGRLRNGTSFCIYTNRLCADRSLSSFLELMGTYLDQIGL